MLSRLRLACTFYLPIATLATASLILPFDPSTNAAWLAILIVASSQLLIALPLSLNGTRYSAPFISVESQWPLTAMAGISVAALACFVIDRLVTEVPITSSAAINRDLWVQDRSGAEFGIRTIWSFSGQLLIGFAPWSIALSSLSVRRNWVSMLMGAISIFAYAWLVGGRSQIIVTLALIISVQICLAGPRWPGIRKLILPAIGLVIGVFFASLVFSQRASRSDVDGFLYLQLMAGKLGADCTADPSTHPIIQWLLITSTYLLHSIWVLGEFLEGTLRPSGTSFGVLWVTMLGKFGIGSGAVSNELEGRFLPLFGCLLHDYGWAGAIAGWAFLVSVCTWAWTGWRRMSDYLLPLRVILVCIALLAPIMNPIDLSIAPSICVSACALALLRRYRSPMTSTVRRAKSAEQSADYKGKNN